jgi:DNA-binding GntR family transcriptional regulator|tara:strand:- start:845 stop:1507 length:663 start_codon:yes stop_codon:yes gene_type:complete
MSPQSSSQRAIHELRELIFSGELAAGSDHLESELAERLNMSRTPVREAALTLEGQGLLELRPRKGLRILPVSPQDIREIYDVLTELEGLAAQRAAEQGYSSAQLIDIKQAMADMDAAVDDNNLEDWARADDQFHRELVRLSGNNRLVHLVGMMSDQVRRARAMTLFIRPIPTQSNEDHRGVVDAIERGDGAEAGRLYRGHCEQAKKMIVELLEKHRLKKL